MSKTLLHQVAAYIDPKDVKRLDALRGEIPRARILSRAIHRYLVDLESGKEKLLPSPEGEEGGEEQQTSKGVWGPDLQSEPPTTKASTVAVLSTTPVKGGSKSK